MLIGVVFEMINILINGIGQFGWGFKLEKYIIWFDEGQVYMLILVNIVVDIIFVFFIDNYILEVIEVDFVFIKLYNMIYIKIGIGKFFLRFING